MTAAPLARLLVPAALCVVVACFFLVLVSILNSIRLDGRERVALQLAVYDQYRSIVGFEPELEAHEKSGDEAAKTTLILSGGPPGVISANLLAQLSQLAASHNVQVLRGTDVPIKRSGEIDFIGIDMELSASLASTLALVSSIQSARPFLVIERMVIRAGGRGGGTDTGDPPLTIELRVVGAGLAIDAPAAGSLPP